HVGDDDMTGAGAFANRNGHATNRTRTGNEHVFADEIERQRCMDGVAQRIETGKHFQRDGRIAVPAVLLRDRYEFCPSTGTIDPDTARVWTQMPSPRETIATMPAGDVTFGYNQIALRKTFHVIAHAIDNADKLVANYHRHRNRLLRPRVPIVDVHVRAA